MDDLQDIDETIAESSVSHKLTLIQKRCTELMEGADDLELTLEEPVLAAESNDPYNQKF